MMTIQFNFRCKSRNTATWILVASLCACVVPLKSSIAQTYPSKPIKLVIPAPPGGGTDHVARLVGAKFQDTTGQLDLKPVAHCASIHLCHCLLYVDAATRNGSSRQRDVCWSQ